MKKPLHIIKTWFETGDVPTQQQFYDAFDSFHHKDNGEIIVEKSVNDAGDVSFKFTDGEILTIEKFVPDVVKPMGYIDGLVSALNTITNNIAALQTGKVDKESGKGLSDTNFTQPEKDKLAGLENYIPPTSYAISFIDGLQDALNTFTQSLDLKVDKEDGKGLSSNDYTDEDKQKLANLNPLGFTEISDNKGNSFQAQKQSDTLTFEGATLDVLNKKIIVDGGSPARFAVVRSGSITHTPEIGSIDKYFNNIDDVLDIVKTNYTGIDFQIYITGSGTYDINTVGTLENITITCNIDNVRLRFSPKVVSASVRSLTFKDGGINAPLTTLDTNLQQTIVFTGGFVFRVKEVKRNQATYLKGHNSFPPFIFTNNVSRKDVECSIFIDTLHHVYSVDKNGYRWGWAGYSMFSNFKYFKKIDVTINKLVVCVPVNLAGGMTTFGSIGAVLDNSGECNIHIKELDISTERVNSGRYNLIQYSGATANPSKLSTFNICVDRVYRNGDTAQWFLCKQIRNGIWNIKTGHNTDLGRCKITFDRGVSNLHFNADINGKTITDYLISVPNDIDAENWENVIIKLKATGIFDKLVFVKNYGSSTGKQTALVVIDGQRVKVNSEWVYIGTSSTSTNYLTKPFLHFVNDSHCEFTGSKDYPITYQNITHQTVTNQIDKSVLVFGSIYHNATNANYPNTSNHRIAKPFNNLIETQGDDL